MTDRARSTQSMVVGQGDREAGSPAAPGVSFEAVYAAEFDYVWHTLRRLGAHDADLEDLAHDVFVVVFRRLSDFDPTKPMRPWLFGIAYRVLADDRRRARNVREIPMEVDVTDDAPGADESMSRTEDRLLLVAALRELTLEQRAVLIMCDIEERSAPDVARVLEIPVNTVYSRLRAARSAFAAATSRLRAQRRRP